MPGTPHPLPTRPEDVPAALAARFNGGDPAALAELYEEGALLAAGPGGAPLTGPALHAANARLQALGLPIEVRPRHVYATGDLALLLVDWLIEGTAPGGGPVRVGATAADVVRRGPDGHWRYAVDSPFGTAPEGLPEE